MTSSTTFAPGIHIDPTLQVCTVSDSFEISQLRAVLCWNGAAKRLKDRDTWIGWDTVTCANRLKLVVHLRRFLVPQEARRPNLANRWLQSNSDILPKPSPSTLKTTTPHIAPKPSASSPKQHHSNAPNQQIAQPPLGRGQV